MTDLYDQFITSISNETNVDISDVSKIYDAIINTITSGLDKTGNIVLPRLLKLKMYTIKSTPEKEHIVDDVVKIIKAKPAKLALRTTKMGDLQSFINVKNQKQTEAAVATEVVEATVGTVVTPVSAVVNIEDVVCIEDED